MPHNEIPQFFSITAGYTTENDIPITLHSPNDNLKPIGPICEFLFAVPIAVSPSHKAFIDFNNAFQDFDRHFICHLP